MFVVLTKCSGSKFVHKEVRFGGKERESRLAWKIERQEMEVGKSGSRNKDVCLRYLAKATPYRLVRVWQHVVVFLLKFLQDEESHRMVRT